KQLMNIIAFNLKDNVNSYVMQEDGTYLAKQPMGDEKEFNVHREFFNVDAAEVLQVKLVE
ncbi:MAG TPA: hypothetical protein VLA71_00195, partial [Algoriphagus sp.]|nr:hypothetical protein [Algoriphagus sp.]